MTSTIVENKPALKKRVKRFFSPYSHNRKDLVKFIESAASYGEVFIFGGAIRDIALYGVRGFSSDVDLVFKGQAQKLHQLADKMSFYQNKFGGYRGCVGHWDVDIWSFEETWAFREGLLTAKHEASLLDTTITNWDSIYYHWNNAELVYKSNYIQDLQDGFLDLVLEENPNQLGSIVRVLRYYLDKNANCFSSRLKNFLLRQLEHYSVEELLHSEAKSYPKNQVLSESTILYVKNALNEKSNEDRKSVV